MTRPLNYLLFFLSQGIKKDIQITKQLINQTITEGTAMKRKIVKITGEVDGKKVFEVIWSAANDDWMRAGRLKARADEGNKEAAAKLKRMQGTPMDIVEDEDEGAPDGKTTK